MSMRSIQSVLLLQGSIAAPSAADKHVLVKDNIKRTSDVYINVTGRSLLQDSDFALKVQHYSIHFIGWDKRNPCSVSFNFSRHHEIQWNEHRFSDSHLNVVSEIDLHLTNHKTVEYTDVPTVKF